MKVIINADDFGINKIVTSEIERMIELKIISSTTIMANGECLDEVKRFAILHPEISFGVHLCMSEFSSITKSPILNKYGLTDEFGIFIKHAIFGLSLFPEELKYAIKEELRAQIRVIKNLGIHISHADSHHHFHTIYQLKSVVNDVLKEFGIEKIRLGTSVEPINIIKQKLFKQNVNTGTKTILSNSVVFPNKSLITRALKGVQMVIYRTLLNAYYKRRFKTTDSFYSYKSFHDKQIKTAKNCLIELMCHPGHPGAVYIEEMNIVKQKSIFKDNSIQLITYNEL